MAFDFKKEFKKFYSPGKIRKLVKIIDSFEKM